MGEDTLTQQAIDESQLVLATLSRRNQELAALNAIANILSHPLEINFALDQVCEQLSSITGMDTATLYLIDEAQPHLNLLAHRGVSDALLSQIQRLGLDDPQTHRIAVEGKSFATDDMGNYIGDGFAGPRQEHYHAGIGVPILMHANPIGAIFVGSRTKLRYEQSDVDLLLTIGSQIAAALENADLYLKMQRRARELEGLASLGAECASSLDSQTISNLAVQQACKLLGTGLGILHLIDGGVLRLSAGYSETEVTFSPTLEIDPVRRMRLANRTPYVIDNCDDESVFEPHRVELSRVGVASFLAVPLVTPNRAIGILGVGHPKPHVWSVTEIDLLQTVANQIAVTLDNADLYAQTKRRVEELSGLAELGAICVGSLDPKVIANATADLTVKLLHADVASVRLVVGDQLYPLAIRATGDLRIPFDARPLGALAPSLVVEHGPWIVNDIRANPNVGGLARTFLETSGLGAMLGMPLHAHDHVIGALTAATSQPRRWSPHEIELIQAIANQVNVALENANLYAQMQQHVKELDGLAHFSTECTCTMDPHMISELAVQWARKLLRVDACALHVFEGDDLCLAVASSERDDLILERRLARDAWLTEMLEKQMPFVVNDIHSGTMALFTVPAHLSRPGFRASITIPLLSRDRALGLLTIMHAAARTWSPHEIGLLQTLANQAANAIHNAQLFLSVLNERRKVQAIFDSGLSGLYATDAEGNIVMFNRAAERITGWTLEQVQGKTWQSLFSDATSLAVEPLINEAIRHKRTMYVPAGRKIRTSDGRIIPVAKAVAPLFDEKENVIGAVGAFWDLSKEQRMELAYESFLETVAHQLRSPLSAVLSSLELYERRNLSQAHRAELWKIAKTEGERLRRFADQFLDHQAAAKSFLPLEMEPLSVASIARRLVQDFRFDRGKRRIDIEVAKPEPLVRGDLSRIENVLRNLLDNAVSYSPDRSTIVIAIEPRGVDRVDIGVQDQGPGIPLDEQDKVFVAFYRSRQTGDRHKYGHGLGLAIAKEMISEMGGEIWVESEPERGTTLHFTLRRAD